ncbi:MAG: CopG family ribbon-helix-helix protein [Candidatus Verstraetearchaeota archaeon]|nr:CopG family ribbon-helix-helix protein [Candidatus Verstraetearchaeota archaeon]
MVVVSLSIPDELLRELDTILGGERYASRSEVVRQAVHKYIMEYRELERLKGDIIATITVLHEKTGKNEDLQLQHEFGDIVTQYLHSHLTERSCLEVMVVKGSSKRLKDLIDGLKANRHVKQLKFSVMAVD